MKRPRGGDVERVAVLHNLRVRYRAKPMMRALAASFVRI